MVEFMLWYKNEYKYSLGDKLKHYTDIVNKVKKGNVSYAKERLVELNKKIDNIKPYDVYICKAKDLGEKVDSKNKRRRVMIGSNVSSETVVAYPCHREEYSCSLDHFDGKRHINKNEIKSIPLDNLYELSSFDDTQDDYISNQDKIRLKRMNI